MRERGRDEREREGVRGSEREGEGGRGREREGEGGSESLCMVQGAVYVCFVGVISIQLHVSYSI